MSSVNILAVSRSYIVRKLVYEVIRDIRRKGLIEYKEMNRIHSDLVPKVNDGKKESILEKEKAPEKSVNPIVKRVNVIPIKDGKLSIMHRKLISPMFNEPKPKDLAPKIKLEAPIETAPKIVPVIPKVEPVKSSKPKVEIKNIPVKEVVKKEVKSSIPLKPSYGKIIPLLMDSQVMVIECSGADRPIQVVAGGQKHITNIKLSEEEINALLQKVSQEVHIPMLEGVFKAVHDKFFINAVVSRMVGSKFIIRKQSPMMSPEGMLGR